MARGIIYGHLNVLWGKSTVIHFLRLKREDHWKKLFIMDRYNAALIGVVLPETRCQCVEKNAALDEVVEEDGALTDAVEFPHQHLDQPIR